MNLLLSLLFSFKFYTPAQSFYRQSNMIRTRRQFQPLQTTRKDRVFGYFVFDRSRYRYYGLMDKCKDRDESSTTRTVTNKELMNGLLNRVDRTLSYKAGMNDNEDDLKTTSMNTAGTVQDILSNVRGQETSSIDSMDLVEPINALLQNATTRSVQMLQVECNNNENDVSVAKTNHDRQHPDYSTNPTITTTALAHSLWSYILRQPGAASTVDNHHIVIDATAGNGHDTLAIAKMLFPQFVGTDDGKKYDHDDYDGNDDIAVVPDTQSMLYAIDIQLTACQNTTSKLSAILPPRIMSNNVQIWHTSHESLPIVTNVTLVVYNLGFLPGSNSKSNDKSITTKTMTTITSIGNAVQILRIGGMLSVTTYSRTNHLEDIAVHVFMETLALFSSQTQSWNDFLTHVPLHPMKLDINSNDDEDDIINVREHLMQTLNLVHDDNPTHKWRVTQHKKLGRLDAPILFTATRIQ